jgi:hypothetical protein
MKTKEDWNFKEETLNFTFVEAEAFVNYQEVPAERPKSDFHADELAAEMLDGNFRWEHVTLMRAILGKVMYRLNGQHTAFARLDLGPGSHHDKKVRCLTYRVDSEDELRILYEVVDKIKPRTNKQRKLTLLAETPGFENVPNEILHRVSKGYEILRWPDAKERKKHKTREVAELMKGADNGICSKVAKFVTEVASRRDGAFVRTPPVCGAMLATFGRNQADSKEFWGAVINGEGLTKSDPRLLLRTMLLSKPTGPGKQRGVAEEQTFQYCLVAWNLWRAGKNVGSLRLPKGGERPSVN